MKRAAICLGVATVGLMLYIVSGCVFGRWCGHLISLVTGSESFGDFMVWPCGMIFYTVMVLTIAGLLHNWEDK